MAFEDTNEWAAYFAAQKQKEQEQRAKAIKKAAATRAYKQNKPQAILNFEEELVRSGCRLPATPYEDRTANGLQRFILDFLDHYDGMHGQRINIGGILMPNGKYRTSGSTKGVSDIIAIVHGKYIGIEVKAGKDKIRDTQIAEQEKVRKAGGVYEVVHNADEFVQLIRDNYL